MAKTIVFRVYLACSIGVIKLELEFKTEQSLYFLPYYHEELVASAHAVLCLKILILFASILKVMFTST